MTLWLGRSVYYEVFQPFLPIMKWQVAKVKFKDKQRSVDILGRDVTDNTFCEWLEVFSITDIDAQRFLTAEWNAPTECLKYYIIYQKAPLNELIDKFTLTKSNVIEESKMTTTKNKKLTRQFKRILFTAITDPFILKFLKTPYLISICVKELIKLLTTESEFFNVAPLLKCLKLLTGVKLEDNLPKDIILTLTDKITPHEGSIEQSLLQY